MQLDMTGHLHVILENSTVHCRIEINNGSVHKLRYEANHLSLLSVEKLPDALKAVIVQVPLTFSLEPLAGFLHDSQHTAYSELQGSLLVEEFHVVQQRITPNANDVQHLLPYHIVTFILVMR